ncbi:DNA adenine methylase [Maricaulis maris]|uniref:site-specific DNA-methyltransferase (adenine-specific) n=1 Tax=Maricaulis maris TaxID=74318 RepID=A0A495DKX2_9PROT|nr:DNA adenine methylase [Maricaulis maris]RKR03576.1 site-specific DNA-adenine methylase [Maricaulis maris]
MTPDSMRPVRPTRTPSAYIGGKRNLAKRICAMIAATPHATYVEPFVGMGGIFLRRTSAPAGEVINDFSGDVANLFRILQRHYPQFMDTLRFQVTSRREFERLQACDPATLTDLERAARFLYLQRVAFGGKVAGRNFGVSVGRGVRFNLNTLAPLLEEVHERLAGVVIENLPWQALIERYDRADTLFYLDPPYWGNEEDYGAGMFGRDEFAELADRLASIKGRFILSINDRPEIRTLFASFNIETATVNYSISGGAGRPAGELVIQSKG